MELHQQFLDQTKEECVFCNPKQELIIESSPHFTLMFDPFALTPGHLLLTSKGHYGCLGEVPEELHDECDELRTKGYALLALHFKTGITRYEHGRAGHCIARGVESRSCHHYHEHLLPAELDLHTKLAPRFKSIAYSEEKDIVDLYDRYHEYLLVQEAHNEKRFYIAKGSEVEAHLLRTLSAEALGHPDLQDWTSYVSCEKMLIGKDILQLSTTKR
jgi:diadenosine tetraphosphate (Ap4A) HIT family hydrolase